MPNIESRRAAARPRVHLLVGLPGAGKTTYARRLAADVPAVRFTLDEWMLRLYTWSYDEPEYVARLDDVQALIWDMARQVLALGHDVVLDWNQWSRARRSVWRQRAEMAGCAVVLHHLMTPLDTAIRRLEERAAAGTTMAHSLDAAGARHMQRLLEIPNCDEGIQIRCVKP